MKETTDKNPKKSLNPIRLVFSYRHNRSARRGRKAIPLCATDRTSKFVAAKLFTRANKENAKAFLEYLLSYVPYKIHTILTDNGIQFADLPKNRNYATALLRGYPFDRVCK